MPKTGEVDAEWTKSISSLRFCNTCTLFVLKRFAIYIRYYFINWHCDVSFFILANTTKCLFMLINRTIKNYMNNVFDFLPKLCSESWQFSSLKDVIHSIFLLTSVSSSENETGSVHSYFPAVRASKGLHRSFSSATANY